MAQDLTSTPQVAVATKAQDYVNIPDDAEIPEEALNNLSQDQLVAVFVEQMIMDKGVQPNDMLRAQLREKMMDRVNKTIASNLPDYLVEKLDAQPEVSEDDLEKAISEAGIDVETITQNAMIEFRNNYLKEEA